MRSLDHGDASFNTSQAGLLALPTAGSLPNPVIRISGIVCRQLPSFNNGRDYSGGSATDLYRLPF